MPKGKKFDAAEKHFLKKEEAYKKRLAAFEEWRANDLKRIWELEQQNVELQTKNNELHEWLDRLLQYTELSEDDIKKACEKDKATADMAKSFSLMMKIAGM